MVPGKGKEERVKKIKGLTVAERWTKTQISREEAEATAVTTSERKSNQSL